MARRHGATLDYHSFEHDLVSVEAIEALGYSALLADPRLVDSLLKLVGWLHEAPGSSGTSRTSGTSGTSGTRKAQIGHDIQLTLHLQDASITDFTKLFNNRFHAIYLDAFSPDSNAECWSAEFISQLAQVLDEDGRLSTYSAKGAVRRAMLAAGLRVRKLPGPPGKREMLVAYW